MASKSLVKKKTHSCLHFWHIYFLSPSYILIAPDRITVPLRVSRIPLCLTLTRPMLGKVSTFTHPNIDINQLFMTKLRIISWKKWLQINIVILNRNKPGHSSGEPLISIRTWMNSFFIPLSKPSKSLNVTFYTQCHITHIKFHHPNKFCSIN